MTGTLHVDQLGMSRYMLWKLKLYVQPWSVVKRAGKFEGEDHVDIRQRNRLRTRLYLPKEIET